MYRSFDEANALNDFTARYNYLALDLSSAEDSSKSFNADLGVDYPIFNMLVLERFPWFIPLCFGL